MTSEAVERSVKDAYEHAYRVSIADVANDLLTLTGSANGVYDSMREALLASKSGEDYAEVARSSSDLAELVDHHRAPASVIDGLKRIEQIARRR